VLVGHFIAIARTRSASSGGEFALAYSANSITRATLLGRLRAAPDDPAAWAEFVQRYGRKIFAWCRAWGLQEADAQDVTQNVFLNLTTRLRNFRYDSKGCFRAWLKTITHHAWQDYIEKRRQLVRSGESDWVYDRLSALEARDDLSSRLLEMIEQEVFREAAARVRLRVEPRTWEAFQMLAIEGRSGTEAAKQLGMKVATVFVARSKVQRMLGEEVKRLQRD
jgi:RNA polymerase sigma factor (sigma-70 family)